MPIEMEFSTIYEEYNLRNKTRNVMKTEYEFFLQSICPGVVISEFQEGLCKDGTLEAMRGGPILFPEDIAESIVYTLSTPPGVQVSG
jgi:NADP-dependent 3-hydroxy acid dehydrogenase YdfG